MEYLYDPAQDFSAHTIVFGMGETGLRDTLFTLGMSSVHELIVKGRAPMLAQFVISLMDSEGHRNDFAPGAAVAFVCAIVSPLVFLRDKNDWRLSVEVMRGLFELSTLERFAWDRDDTWKEGVKREIGYFERTYGMTWTQMIRPLQEFLVSIPGYDKGNMGFQGDRALDEYSQLTVQLFRTLGRLRLSR